MGRTPLHLAAERNTSAKAAEILLEYGAHLNAKDDQGMTPLDVANHHGKSVVALWLKKNLAKKRSK